MLRVLVAGLFAAGLALAAPAQDKKDDKKAPAKPKRIAVSEPKDVATDLDFVVQGEYEGKTFTASDAVPKGQGVGLQLIARGEAKFDAVVYHGGLPGAGWDGKAPLKGTAKRDDTRMSVAGGEKDAAFGGSGTIAHHIIAFTYKGASVTLTRVERKSKTLGASPPEGATVLFGAAGDEKNWAGGKLVALSDGKFLDVGVKSKQKFGAFKAHVEFRLPWMPNSTGQQRGNSGVYLQDRYECQVLDSFGLSGENNECGGIYTQHKPLVNMCLPPMAWQTYDIEFTPAAFDADGKKTKNGRVTILHNGVKIHDGVEFPKECPGGQKETAEPGPFQFQNHGDPVVFRNVWVVEVK